MANNVQNPPGPQPDFGLISETHQNLADGHQTLSNELGKIPNLPQFHNPNVILDELRQIKDRLGGIDDRLNGIDDKLDVMTTTLQIGDQNNAARVANSLLTISNERLTELVNPTDGSPITGFPASPRDIRRMKSEALVSILRQLGLRTDGQKAAKEQRLRGFIGLKTNPA